MKKTPFSHDELTVKQRLAVSRQALVAAIDAPILGRLIEWGISRLARGSDVRIKAPSTPARDGRTPS